jgi:hypothetical protein
LQWTADLADALTASREQGSLGPLEGALAGLAPSRTTGTGNSFVDAAWWLAVAGDGQGAAAPTLDRLVWAGLERMVNKLCVGPLEPDLVPAWFSSAGNPCSYVEACMSEVQLGALAKQVVRGGCVRAPRSRLARPGTKGLLHVAID